jgi:hypothetical protein
MISYSYKLSMAFRSDIRLSTLTSGRLVWVKPRQFKPIFVLPDNISNFASPRCKYENQKTNTRFSIFFISYPCYYNPWLQTVFRDKPQN